MATAVPPPHLPLFFFFFFASTIITATASPPPAPAPAPPSLPSCTNELVSFSPCLSFVSSPPNNLDDAASASCCDAFSSAVNSGAAVCFCYLLREPPILGFPLNTTRLMSLSLVCPPARAPSLDSLCSESSSSLPPLNKSDTLGLTSASTADSSNRVSPLAAIPLNDSDTGGGGNNESGGNATKYGGSKGGEGGGHNHNHSSESEGISSEYMSWLLLRSTLFTFILPLVCHHL